MRTLAALLVLSIPLLSQGISVPFSMNGGPMQLQGTFTTSNGSVCCSGVVDIGGEQGSFGSCSPTYSNGGCWEWRFAVHLDEATYIIRIWVNAVTGLLSGSWYVAGSHAPPVPLYP